MSSTARWSMTDIANKMLVGFLNVSFTEFKFLSTFSLFQANAAQEASIFQRENVHKTRKCLMEDMKLFYSYVGIDLNCQMETNFSGLIKCRRFYGENGWAWMLNSTIIMTKASCAYRI